jgi:hypothetical protein
MERLLGSASIGLHQPDAHSSCRHDDKGEEELSAP